MTRFTEKANAITPSRELQPDEYFNETDHLIYCSKCNTPRQCRHELQGKVLIPSIRCKCQQEIFEQEEAQRKLHEKQMEIEHLKTSGLQDKALYDYTFARDNGINPEIKLAHNYVSNWEEMKANASGLLIWGDVGTGKSFFAGCIANALLEKGVPVLMTNFSRILNTLTGMHFEDRNQFINSLNRYSLLIIDDLGIERNSDFALEQVFNVIDSRYRSKKPLIITTNLTLSELNNAADIAHKRIYDRILERCIPVRINNRDIRQDNATADKALGRAHEPRRGYHCLIYQVVSKCALREENLCVYIPRSRIISSRFRESKSISLIWGTILSRIAPSWTNLCVLASRSFLRFLASASSWRCFACKSAFSSGVIILLSAISGTSFLCPYPGGFGFKILCFGTMVLDN